MSAERGALLVVGDPGHGKTHLFCDTARKRMMGGLVTVLVMGQHLESGALLWPQLARLLGVPTWSKDEILDRLEERARRSGSRGLILVDALNEGGGVDVWPAALAGFINDIRRRPWLAIAVSCRSSYEAYLVRPRARRLLTRVTHEGFAYQTEEAIAAFFAHYGLQLPRAPLLRYEYGNPLFLKLFCATLAEGKVKMPALGQEGVNHLYEHFCKGVGQKIARELGDPALRALPWLCAKEFARSLATTGVDALSRSSAKRLVAKVCAGRTDANRMYRAMINEGLLAEDIRTTGAVATPITRFPYQHFSDHLIGRYLLTAHLKKEDVAGSFAPSSTLGALAADEATAARHSGLLEALAVQLPERVPVELLEVLAPRAWPCLYRAALASIAWRKPRAFPDADALIRQLNKGLRLRAYEEGEILDTLLTVASVPGHPFGAEFLHRNLERRALPVRDATWSVYLHDQWGASSIVDRLIRWGEEQDTSRVGDDEVEAVAILTTWFFTSANRFLRDRATKVLVRLLRGRLTVLRGLLARFADVDDPYVHERLYTAAYGCALLSDDAGAVAALARQVYDRFFPEAGPPTSHVLTRDAARGVIERALALDPSLPGFDSARFRPPYASAWPLRAHSEARLKQRLGQAGAGIYWSVSNMGDFGRYVLARAASDFSTIALERMPPVGRTPRTPTLPTLPMSREAVLNSLLVRASTPAKRPTDNRIDLNHLRRWVLGRVLKMGWTPSRFEAFDRRVHYGDVREPRKAERIGKKYEWIALHEGLGMLADHVWLKDGWGGSAKYRAYEGPWDLGVRDIDPSQLGMRPPEQAGPVWWHPVSPLLKAVDRDAQTRWVERRDATAIPRLLVVRDEDRQCWVTLEAHYEWSEPERAPGLKRDTARFRWLAVQAYFVPNGAMRAAEERVGQLRSHDLPGSLEVRGVFLHEIPWHPSYQAVQRMWEHDGAVDPQLRVPNERYAWSAAPDASIGTDCLGYMPSAVVRDVLPSGATEIPFAYGSPTPTAVDPSWQRSGPPASLLRADAVAAFTRATGTTLIWVVQGELYLVYGRPDGDTPRRGLHGRFRLARGAVKGRLHQHLERPERLE